MGQANGVHVGRNGMMQQAAEGETIRVRGLVQGVGFRPTVWRIAHELGLLGDVCNDGAGVLIQAVGPKSAIDAFCDRLQSDSPPLARIDALLRTPATLTKTYLGFEIVGSAAGMIRTGIVPDAASCSSCRSEIVDPEDRRYGYAFTNCTHCGPRLSIIRSIPYDRENTSMSVFRMCAKCEAEYRDPSDRRFHAQPNACPDCGPQLRLYGTDGSRQEDADRGGVVNMANRLLRDGCILAIRGIGGFHLACDATNSAAVRKLRTRKKRFGKPFALMARDLDVIRQFCVVGDQESALLTSAAAPIVLLQRHEQQTLPETIAPGQQSLGFMLPYSPLHLLLLAPWDSPIVMTSGNLSHEPQCIDLEGAQDRLQGLADAYLTHDREIVNRVDDSVARVFLGRPLLLRRARGYAPAPIGLPPGFENAPPVLAFGGELKNTLCLLRDGEAVVSQHLGDLEDARTAAEYERTIALYERLFQHRAQVLAADLHPDYRSSRIAEANAVSRGTQLMGVQHHFAHIASVLADNKYPLDSGAVVGIALDGLGYGDDGTLWGGEFLLADYRGFRRLAHLKQARLPGGSMAMREPWRNTYAHLVEHVGWATFESAYAEDELYRWLTTQPLAILERMLSRGLNSPLSSSCGRLFDAVAAALDICRAEAMYEGQAAIELEALAQRSNDRGNAYPFAVIDGSERTPLQLDPAPMWCALLEDLHVGVNRGVIAKRFHLGLGRAVAALATRLAHENACDTVALSGGVMQNCLLVETICDCLQADGLHILRHEQVPANDGGLSLGQAVVAAAAHLPTIHVEAGNDA